MPSETHKKQAAGVGLPVRVFLYTLDQIATMLDISVDTLKAKHIYFDGKSIGAKHRSLMMARNIGDEDRPDWRVLEEEFVRWMRLKRYRIYERGWGRA